MRDQNLRAGNAQINVTPLIDVLLVLLIIFMVISPARSLGLEGRIPRMVSEKGSSEEPIVVVFDRKQSLRIQSEVVPKTELSHRLVQILKPRIDRSVFLEADAALRFEAVAEVMDIVHSAGAQNLGLVTNHPPRR